MTTPAHVHFANLCRRVRRCYPRFWFAKRFGLNGRALQDLEQGRALPSRALVVLLKAIELDRTFMERVAKEAAADLALLEQARVSRN